MLEIYNEIVRDLLVASQGDRKKGLEVRQDPNNGFFGKQFDFFKTKRYDWINFSVFVGIKSLSSFIYEKNNKKQLNQNSTRIKKTTSIFV